MLRAACRPCRAVRRVPYLAQTSRLFRCVRWPGCQPHTCVLTHVPLVPWGLDNVQRGAALTQQQQRPRSNSFLSYFRGQKKGTGAGGDGIAPNLLAARAQQVDSDRESDPVLIAQEQRQLAAAVALHKQRLREQAQREARARAESENAAWQATLAEAEARAAAEELARAEALEFDLHDPFGTDLSVADALGTTNLVLAKIVAKQREVMLRDGVEQNSVIRVSV